MNAKEMENLRESLIKLYDILKSNASSNTRYAEYEIPLLIQFLDETLKGEGTLSSNDAHALKSRFASMFPPKSGLSEFYIWNDDFPTRKKENNAYWQLIQEIQRILQ